MRHSVWSLGAFTMLMFLAACGSDKGGGATACTQTGNLTLHSTSTSTAPLLSTSVTVTKGSATVTRPVYVSYVAPPVAAIAAGYPPEGPNPLTLGMDISESTFPPDNPLLFTLLFYTSGATGTYHATWRFAAADASGKVVGCNDLPVTFTIQ